MYMEPEQQPPGGPDDRLGAFRRAVAHDTLSLALLHNAELSGEMIGRLQAEAFPQGLQLELVSERGREAAEMLREGIRLIGEDPADEAIDELAADYAAIYLTHALRASPCESVWIDDEGLAMQEPMFQVRDYYQRHGLAVQDWRKRSDDHLVLQLQFVSHLFQGGAPLEEAARFLDEHLLRWVSDFAARVAGRCGTPFYAGLGAFTAAYLEELRDLVAELLDQARPSAEEIERRMKPRPEVALPEPKFVPGGSASW